MYSEAQTARSDQLVRQHAKLVKRIAHHLIARLPASVQVEDLIQAGMMGLLEAARKYESSKGAAFETYAGIRIRGAMMDEVRKSDWVPRSVHRNARMISDAINVVENRLGRDATDEEIASELNMTIADYHACLRDSHGGKLFSYEELNEQGGSVADTPDELDKAPEQVAFDSAFKNELAQAISHLPEREQLVLSMYYDQELNLKEIGQVLEVSESRVSQIHSQAAARLKSRLSLWRS